MNNEYLGLDASNTDESAYYVTGINESIGALNSYTSEAKSPRAICPVHGDIGSYWQGGGDSASLLVVTFDNKEVAFCAWCLQQALVTLGVSVVERRQAEEKP